MKPLRPILVCGGAGYVGAHMCKQLARAGYHPITFSTGQRWAVKWGPLIEGDLLDRQALTSLPVEHQFEAVLHFAAKSSVAESVREPSFYYRNNIIGTLNLLDAMPSAGVAHLAFSSTAAMYGDPDYILIDEAHPTQPINPYGWSK
jgi:UDP-glucose 4-epimerase